MDTIDTAIESRALAAVKVLSRLGGVRAAYLFGSHVDGTPDEWSDIDVAVFMEGVETWDLHRRATAMALVMEEVGSDVEAHFFPAESLEHHHSASFAAWVLNHGVRLAG